MKKIIDVLQEVMEGGFEQAGYDKKFGFVTVSNRPDLCLLYTSDAADEL